MEVLILRKYSSLPALAAKQNKISRNASYQGRVARNNDSQLHPLWVTP
jgi:hypothetical protein